MEIILVILQKHQYFLGHLDKILKWIKKFISLLKSQHNNIRGERDIYLRAEVGFY